jgi:hypothetical protein
MFVKQKEQVVNGFQRLTGISLFAQSIYLLFLLDRLEGASGGL